ncbi:TPA: hypothetical protein ACJ569_001262 [Kluyvera cryocrescens]
MAAVTLSMALMVLQVAFPGADTHQVAMVMTGISPLDVPVVAVGHHRHSVVVAVAVAPELKAELQVLRQMVTALAVAAAVVNTEITLA